MNYQKTTPNGVTCPHWTPCDPPKGRACRSYPGGGGCTLLASGECSEWRKVNPVRLVTWRRALPGGGAIAGPFSPPTPPAAAQGPARGGPAAAQAPPGRADGSPEPLTLVPPPPKPETAAQRARRAFEATLAPTGPVVQLTPPPFEPAKSIPEAELVALEELAEEITLTTPELGEVFLVREHTAADRLELTFREAATLRLIVDSFPGARIVGFRKGELE